MPYNERLANRIRTELGHYPGLVEKKMFGGVAFLVHGNMSCGVHGDDIVVKRSLLPARLPEHRNRCLPQIRRTEYYHPVLNP
jgi:hypothetical protein